MSVPPSTPNCASAPLAGGDSGAMSSWPALGPKELDEEGHLALRLDLVLHVGWDGLPCLGSDEDVERRFGLGREAEVTSHDAEPTPEAATHPMRLAERDRHGVLVPDLGGSHDVEALRRLRPITQRAVEQRPHSTGATALVENPGSQLERRAMTDVLAVPAVEVSNPGLGIVLSEADDGSPHLGSPSVTSGPLRTLILPSLALRSKATGSCWQRRRTLRRRPETAPRGEPRPQRPRLRAPSCRDWGNRLPSGHSWYSLRV